MLYADINAISSYNHSQGADLVARNTVSVLLAEAGAYLLTRGGMTPETEARVVAINNAAFDALCAKVEQPA